MSSMPLRMIRAATELFETLDRTGDALDRAMVLLHDVVEGLALPNHDVGAVLGVEVTDLGLVRSALIDTARVKNHCAA